MTPLATGSKEYIKWVQEQTLKKDPQQAFFNIRPEAAIQALDNAIPDLSHVQLSSQSISDSDDGSDEEDVEDEEDDE